MLSSKRQKGRLASSTSSPSHQLFVDYPYPIINQLTEKQKRELERESKHRLSSTLASLEWHRENLRKIFSLLHHSSPSAIVAESLRQAHRSDRSSKAMGNNPKNEEIKQRRARRRPLNKLQFSINDDKG